jgi:hypothetical protein
LSISGVSAFSGVVVTVVAVITIVP